MFSIEGKLFKALTKAGDFLILGFFGVLFSLPIVTIGASLTAMFYVGMKLVRDEESYVFRGFFKAWKQNFKQGFLMELIVAVIAALLITDVRICYTWANDGGGFAVRLFMFALIGILLVLSAVVLYAFPMLAKFDNSVIKTLKNSLILCMHHLPQTFIMLFATYGLIIFSINYFTAFIVTIPLILYIDSYILARIFLIYVKQSKGENEEEAEIEAMEEDGIGAENKTEAVAENEIEAGCDEIGAEGEEKTPESGDGAIKDDTAEQK